MVVGSAPIGRKASVPDWRSRRAIVPGWLFSFAIHALTLLLLAFWYQAQPKAPVGFGGDGPEIGIIVSQRGEFIESTNTEPSTSQATVDGPTEAETPAEATTTETASTEPPSGTSAPAAKVASELPDLPLFPSQAGSSGITRPVVGAGLGTGIAGDSAAYSDVREVVKAGGIRAGGKASASGTPGTAFMGVADQGSRVVFVIDCSGSMAEHGAMRVAKSALVSSLQSLDSIQQFQVIFFNERPEPLRLRSESKPILYFATDIFKTLARQSISAQLPVMGTQRDLAVVEALKLNPEVIFVLTDAGEPILVARDLKKIADLNRGRTRIHTIEFGKGEQLAGPENFLQKLARQNGGTHRYHDITQFDLPGRTSSN